MNKALPDLILLDVVMPVMDGFETCRRLKAEEQTKDIPVIFMTAVADFANPENKIKGLTLGAVDYISKPIQLDEVLARVKTHLYWRSLTQQLQVQNILLCQEIQERKQAQEELALNAQRSALRADAGTNKDISDRKLKEAALHQRQQEFIAFVENSPDIVARLDRKLRHL